MTMTLRRGIIGSAMLIGTAGMPTIALAQKISLPRPGSSQVAVPNELTPAERAAGWKLLFNGKSFAGWRGVGIDTVPRWHWRVVKGSITRLRPDDAPPGEEADLLSADTFLDFELSWEWKIDAGGNSGVKYNVSEDLSRQQAAPYAALGFEYQLLDDSLAEDNRIPSHRSGALFDVLAPNEKKHLRPPGDWNQSAIVVRAGHAEHWLNGDQIVAYDLGTAAMDSALARSKFRSVRGFAEHRRGHIALQDHGSGVSFRSIKIRALEP